MRVDEALTELPLVAIVRGVKPAEVEGVAQALYAAGVRCLEVPLNSPEPLESIRRLKAFAGRMAYGAGTVLTSEAVDAVAEAGGELIVSPNTDPAVIRRTLERGMVPMPGFGSATEAFAAIAAGARQLKLFPASTYGPDHLKALRAVLPPDASVSPVGGVKPEDFASWWAAGARGFGLGGELYKPGMRPDEIHRRARAAAEALKPLLAA